ncbi:MAG TPA: organic hydroperoxide resistance protein [Actinophytocola sp.]|jgi:Ohr subfamily peroxiredoxin|uniref:organic hydroperoxide resistance protein n=1 Tax=Actinophytocola sp. TaxID=1872138 RepID=UPI002F95508E
MKETITVEALYVARATSTGAGRQGHVRSDDGIIDYDLSMPKEMGGAGGTGTNPEQLFAAGYAACFHNALLRMARMAKVRIPGSSVSAEVGIGRAGEGFGLAVTLVIDIPDVDHAQAQELVAAAHRVCPYSNATRGNIDVELKVA